MPADTPILSAHIEDTVQAIAKLHADYATSVMTLLRAHLPARSVRHGFGAV